MRDNKNPVDKDLIMGVKSKKFPQLVPRFRVLTSQSHQVMRERLLETNLSCGDSEYDLRITQTILRTDLELRLRNYPPLCI